MSFRDISLLETFPTEVLERVALALVDEDLRGPPIHLPSLVSVSKTVYTKISAKFNPFLYSKIFAIKFDTEPVVRRLGESCKHARRCADELIKRFRTLKRFKFTSCREHSTSLTARDDLWVAYLLFLEHDEHNYEQLVRYAEIDKFVANFVRPGEPFHDGAAENGGWRIDSEMNALVAWLFWFTDKERVANETSEDHKRILTAFSHVFVGSFKYPSTHAPITSFLIPPLNPPLAPPPGPALPLAALPSSRPTYVKDHFGHNVPITHPLFTPAALLICAVRLEAARVDTLFTLPAPAGHGSHDAQTCSKTPFAEWDTGCSKRYERDWMRLITCYSPWTQPMIRRHVFTPGMMTGTWVGRMFEIPPRQFDSILDPIQHTAESPQVNVYPKPMQFHLLEYHQHDPSKVIGYNDFSRDFKGEGVFKAWIPQGLLMSEGPSHLNFSPTKPYGWLEESRYDLYDPCDVARRALDDEFARRGSYSNGVHDIILIARTDKTFGTVWGDKIYYGRVRDWDGLIVLVSADTEREPSLLFSGYVHGDQNLVGRWRETQTPVEQPGWEGAWTMRKIS